MYNEDIINEKRLIHMKMIFWNDRQQDEMNAWITSLSRLGIKFKITEFSRITQVKVLK